jgi:hypothetical protein
VHPIWMLLIEIPANFDFYINFLYMSIRPNYDGLTLDDDPHRLQEGTKEF